MRTQTAASLSFLFLILSLLGTPRPAEATAYHSFLRINKVYVLYTDPIVPHADTKGNFWVGLAPTVQLIGAQMAEGGDGSATLTFRGHRLVFSPGAGTALLDGKIMTLSAPTKRIGASHRMVVPLKALLAAFGLHSEWDKRYHVLTLTDSDLISRGALAEFCQLITQMEGPPLAFSAQVKAFTGPPYPLGPIVPVISNQKWKGNVWVLKNTSGRGYPKLFIGEEISGYDYYDTGTNVIQFPQSKPLTYPISAHGLLRVPLPIMGNSSHKPVRYAVAWIIQ